MDNEKFVALKKRQAALRHEQRAIEAQLQELNEAPPTPAATPAVAPEPVAPEETPAGNEGGSESPVNDSSTSPDDPSASVTDDDTPPIETPDEEGKGTSGESSATPN